MILHNSIEDPLTTQMWVMTTGPLYLEMHHSIQNSPTICVLYIAHFLFNSFMVMTRSSVSG